VMYRNFGRRVKQQRLLLEMTQSDLSEKAGISLSFLGHIERGTRKASLDTVVKLANALKVSPNHLLQDSLDEDILANSSSRDVGVSQDQIRLLREIIRSAQNYDSSLPQR